MAERTSLLLRISPELKAELARWAADELRSVNGHIEFLLREAVRERRRPRKLPPEAASTDPEPARGEPGTDRGTERGTDRKREHGPDRGPEPNRDR
ncbi:MAG: hypothetical protein U0167_10930 [bacterium]